MTREELEKLEAEQSTAAFYFLSAYRDIIIQTRESENFQEKMKVFDEYVDKINLEKTPEQIAQAVHDIEVIEYTKARLENFLELRADDPNAAEIKAEVKSLGMTKAQYTGAVFAAAGKDQGKLAEFFRSDSEAVLPDAKKEFEVIRAKSVLRLHNAMKDYKDGNTRSYAHLLADGLKESCEQFSKSKTRDAAMQWSSHAAQIRAAFNMKPELIKESGLTPGMIDIADEVTGLGKSIEEGLQAIETMANNDLAGKPPLSDEVKQKLLGQVLKMQLATQDSMLVDIQKRWHKEVTKELPGNTVKPKEVETPCKVL